MYYGGQITAINFEMAQRARLKQIGGCFGRLAEQIPGDIYQREHKLQVNDAEAMKADLSSAEEQYLRVQTESFVDKIDCLAQATIRNKKNLREAGSRIQKLEERSADFMTLS